jgi:hypothetical protein
MSLLLLLDCPKKMPQCGVARRKTKARTRAQVSPQRLLVRICNKLVSANRRSRQTGSALEWMRMISTLCWLVYI